MNYTLEGKIDFNKELLTMICCEEEQIKPEACLISGQPLDKDYITLACGHKFNYLSIVEEVRQQRRPTLLETQKINTRQVKCPYCRGVQQGILPYKESEAGKINGVNWPPSKSWRPYKCKAFYKHGKRKGHTCLRPTATTYCAQHKSWATPSQIHNLPATNTIVGGTVQLAPSRCQTILRYGKRKGQRCLCRSKSDKIQTCRRHIQKKDNKQ